jgi:hypothetical protein
MVDKKGVSKRKGPVYCTLLQPITESSTTPNDFTTVKVGITTDLKRRLSSYESHNPVRTQMPAVSLGGAALEKEIKKALLHHRAKPGSSEWFIVPNTMLNDICKAASCSWTLDTKEISKLLSTCHNKPQPS